MRFERQTNEYNNRESFYYVNKWKSCSIQNNNPRGKCAVYIDFASYVQTEMAWFDKTGFVNFKKGNQEKYDSFFYLEFELKNTVLNPI